MIRRATPADLPRLVPLVEQYWAFEQISGFEPARIESNLRQLLSQAQLGGVWISHDEAEPIGYLIAVSVFSLEHGGLMAEIDELFVAPAARSRGVASLLLHTAENALAEAGCVCVQLQLGRDNAAVRTFYYHHGYSQRSGYELLDKPLPLSR